MRYDEPMGREEPSTLTQGGALFSLVPLVWNRTQNSRVAGASPTTSPSGDLIPTTDDGDLGL
jgi:hypothetical protein